MRKILAGLVSGIALLGLAACDGGGGDPAAQGIDGGAQTEQPADPGAADPAAPDTGTAQ